MNIIWFCLCHSLRTANNKIKCPGFIMARTGIDDASVVASITVAQCSVVCNLKHCSPIGEVASSEVSIPHSNSSAIGIVPVCWCMRGIAGSTVNINPTVSVRVCIKCCLVETVAIISKLNDQRIIP